MKRSPHSLLLSLALASSVFAEDIPAVFRVAQEVINPKLIPFTATMESIFGESFLRAGGQGFEPIQWRQRVTALKDAPNRVVADPSTLTHFNSFRQGMLDGAEVLVFRIMNGKFALVRKDKVKAGGHAASGWNFPTSGKEMIAPDQTTYHGGFEEWSRPEVPYWFDLVAVDSQGRMGPPSASVRVERGRGAAKKEKESAIVPYKAPKPVKGQEPEGFTDKLAAPANFRAKFDETTGQPIFTWDPVPGAAGYRLRRSDEEPAQHRGYYLDLESVADSPAKEIKKGDMVMVRKEILNNSRKQLMSNRVFDASNALRDIIPLYGNSLGFPDEDPVLPGPTPPTRKILRWKTPDDTP